MSVIIVKTKDGSVKAYHNVCRHRGNKLVWNDFPNEETSGTCRQFTCKYHAWRYDLDGKLTFIQQEEEFFDVDKSDYGLVGGSLRVVGRLHLHQLRPARQAADRLPGTAGQGHRGLPLPRDDRDLFVPGRGRQQLEAVHGRVRRVLPRAGVAPGAVHQGRGRQDPEVRLRGAVLRDGESARDDLDLGRPGAARVHGHGQADGPGAAQRAVRSLGQAGGHGESHRDAGGRQPEEGAAMGHRRVALLPELDAADLGAGLVPDLSLLADRRRQAHLRDARCTSSRRRTRGSGWPRSWPR